MKFTTTQSVFSQNLSFVGRAVSSRPSHPVLANILLQADKKAQTITLTAFDLSLGIKVSFAAEVKEEGKITIPAKLLIDIISRQPEGSITLSLKDEEGLKIELKSASGKYSIQGMTAEEFPKLPEVEAEPILLPVEVLLDGLRGTLFASSNDETKQVLTGVHLTMNGSAIELGSTDGHRLAVVTHDDRADEIKAEYEATIPAKALQELQKLLEKSDSALTLKGDGGQAVFEIGDYCLTSRLLEGQYPNYQQLIPKQFSRNLTIDRRSLLQSLERIAVLADQKNNIVKMAIEPTQITLSVEAQDVGSGTEVLSCQMTGDALDIAFNVKYLMEGLKAISTSEVMVELNTATSPAVVRPICGLKMTYLIMPCQIRG